ncbi:hypothetical protein M404DRAFT_170289 [Pisolithus tinctorius Marx 270]|uniref:C2H2-type domain-containing protein n=1 Tax=Pisolithus tinctorius Marx 270 TaxID=870435 RepID=A0A0C3NDW4_PISTI|nr:hypothetical protein M404DRAFT_170289 [Pisolithus tinctorius Marx 270]
MPPARDDHTRRRPMQRPFETLRHPCDEPGCNRWFKNLSGLTQHKRTIHPCFHLFNQDRTGSPGDLGQEDDTLPSVNGHTAGVDDGHQEQDPLDQEREQVRTEFVGPGRKLYRNYHTGLDARRCDAEGNFLPDDAPPPPRVQKSLDDWTPYRNRLEFELTDFLFTHAEMSAKKLDTLLEIWAASLLALGGDPLFNNHAELYRVIDSTCVGEVPWEDFTIRYTAEVRDEETAPWMFDNYDVWYRDPQKVIHNILASSNLAAKMDYVPYREYDATNNERRWQDFMSGNWAWEEADRIIHEFPMTGGATLVPIILGSDKTTVSVATGQTDYYPLYLSIGNVHNTVRRAHHNTVVLIAFLAMPKTTREHANTPEFRKFKRQLFHSSLTRILNSLHPAMKVPEVVRFGDGYYRRVIYRLAAYIADYEEQVLLSCIVRNWCPKCLAHRENLDADALRRHRDHSDTVIAVLELRDLWDKYGIVGDLIPFTNDFLRADIHRMLSPDILHQLIKGGFKDHLVDWVEKYLINIHGKTKAEKILDDIDCRIAAVAPFTGLRRFPQGRHFKQWTGDDSKGLMKVYIAAIQGYVPRDMVRTFRAFLEFCYLVRRNVVTERTLAEIDDALGRFHYYREVFRNAGVVDSFSLPRQHAMKHYHHLICQFGAPNGLCSSITESKHIKAVKRPYRRTNRFQALGQMLLINQRLDKLSAARADFEERGMLNGTCLTHVLEVLGRNASDEAEEPTASYEEDSSDTVDTPMTINAHVLLARTYQRKRAKDVGSLAAELEMPQFPEILRRFLHGQLYPADACDPQEIPFDECPFYDGKLRIYNSASSTFFAPSDLSGVYGMRREYIRSCPMWRNEGPRFDCVFVVTDPQAEGMRALDVARVLCFFSFKYLQTVYPCAIVHWFDRVGDNPDEDTGMWIVCPSYLAPRTHNIRNLAAIHVDTIYRAAHLIPIYSTHNINSRDVRPHCSYDMFHSFYVNKFADHHTFEIAF